MSPSWPEVCILLLSVLVLFLELFGHVLLRPPKKANFRFHKLFSFSLRIEKRDKYSRRRPYNDDADIDYINERNAKFNKKAERFYGKYTAEIKQNLERGTAV